MREALAAVVRWSGAEALLRRLRGRHKVGVLVYHDPTLERFGDHMQFLSRRYSFISLGRLVTALSTGDWSDIPPNALVVTFDDGHRGNRDLLPIFERYDVQPTIYLCANVVQGDGLFWFQLPGIDPEPLKLKTTVERRAATSAATAQVGDGDRHALAPDDVATLAGVVELGSHTLSHPALPLCTDAEAQEEVGRSRVEVERLSGTRCDHFSFPNGDYTEREIEIVRRAGYASARTTDIGWNGPGTNPLRLRVISLSDHASVNMLAAHLTGVLRVRRLVPGLLHRRRLNARIALVRQGELTRT